MSFLCFNAQAELHESHIEEGLLQSAPLFLLRLKRRTIKPTAAAITMDIVIIICMAQTV